MKSIAICCSQRFKNEMMLWKKALERAGVPIVMIPDFRWHSKKRIKSPEHERLKSPAYRRAVPGWVRGHLDKIRKVDTVFIFNKRSYIGRNTTLELGAAHILGKIIFALERDTKEPCCDILIDRVVKTPEELAALLR